MAINSGPCPHYNERGQRITCSDAEREVQQGRPEFPKQSDAYAHMLSEVAGQLASAAWTLRAVATWIRDREADRG